MATMTALAVPMTGANRDALVLSRDQLVREPLGGRTWRGTLTHRGDGLCTAVAVEIRFLDRNGRVMGGFSGRAERLAPGGGLELQSRLPVVYITGDSGYEWRSQGVPESIVIEKPFVAAQIVTAVAAARNEASG